LGKGLAGLMIELDQQHRAMDAVIENAVFFHAADLAYGSKRSVGRRVRRKINVLDFTVLSERKCESKAERRVDR
jgi:hypothetical protein